LQTRTGFEDWFGSRNLFLEHEPHTTTPQLRQWCLTLNQLHLYSNIKSDQNIIKLILTRLLRTVKFVFLQTIQMGEALSGTQTAACSEAGRLPASDIKM
jgi:hypothetical protein